MSTPGALTPVEPGAGPETGATLKQRYLLREVRGRGGFATVYHAFDRDCETAVAVKLLDRIPDAATRRRFDLESKIGARMTHPRLIRVIDRGEYAKRPFAVMPLLHGKPLTSRCGGDWRGVCRLMSQYLDGMRALHEARAFSLDAHRTRLLHRDIKPANCFVSADDDLTILDFGLVKVLDQPVHATTAGQLMGSPAYMAPECLFGEIASERSDVYSLGVTFFELLTGERPYEGDMRALHAIFAERRPPPSVRDRRPEVPREIVDLVRQAMALVPAERPPTVAAMFARLQTTLLRLRSDVPGRPLAAPTRPVGPGIIAPLAPDSAPGPAPALVVAPRPADGARPPIWPTLLLGTATVILVAVAAGRLLVAMRAGGASTGEDAAAAALAPYLSGDRENLWARLHAGPGDADAARRSATTRAAAPPAPLAASVALPAAAAPPSVAPASTPVRPASTRRREGRAGERAAPGLTQARVTAATSAHAASLRRCTDAPDGPVPLRLTIARHRVTLRQIDFKAVNPSDRWHACARRVLARMELPAGAGDFDVVVVL